MCFRNLKLLFYLSPLIVLYACSVKQYPGYYLPGALSNGVAYLPRPMEADSTKVKNYISAGISNVSQPYSSGELMAGNISFSRGHQTKNLNYAYGAFGYAGSITEDTFNDFYNDKKRHFDGLYGKGTYGGGLRAIIGFYDTSNRAEFRLLNWENALTFEGGSYSKFRKQVADSINVITTTKNIIYTTGFSSEIIWHSKKKVTTQYAFRLFYGFTPGLTKSMVVNTDLEERRMRDRVFSLSFYAKFNKLFLNYEGTGGENYRGARLNLGYAF